MVGAVKNKWKKLNLESPFHFFVPISISKILFCKFPVNSRLNSDEREWGLGTDLFNKIRNEMLLDSGRFVYISIFGKREHLLK